MPLVNVQKYVDLTDFTAHSRNFQIIYIFKSCKYSLRFVAQVCLDHAEHIYIWKVKITESKRCIESNQLIKVYTRAQPMQPALCCVQSVVCICTLQPWLTQPVLSVSMSEPASLLIVMYQAYEYCRMCVRTMTEHVSVPQCRVCTFVSFSRNCRIQQWPCTCITNSDQLIVSDAECFDSVIFTFHM